MNTRLRMPIVALAATLVATTALAQPGGRREGEPRPPHARGEGRPDRDAPPVTPEELRERIARRLDMLRGEEVRLQRALVQLEEGQDVQRVYAGLRQRDGSPRGGPPDMEGQDGAPVEFSPEMAPRVMRFLETNRPELYRRLREAQERNPERFHEMIRERWPRIREMLAERTGERGRHDAAIGRMRELDGRIRDLAARTSESEGEARAAAEAELRAAIEEQFDLHAENARAEIEALQRRIGDLTERLDDATAGRATMVDDRMRELLAPSTSPQAPAPAP